MFWGGGGACLCGLIHRGTASRASRLCPAGDDGRAHAEAEHTPQTRAACGAADGPARVARIGRCRTAQRSAAVRHGGCVRGSGPSVSRRPPRPSDLQAPPSPRLPSDTGSPASTRPDALKTRSAPPLSMARGVVGGGPRPFPGPIILLRALPPLPNSRPPVPMPLCHRHATRNGCGPPLQQQCRGKPYFGMSQPKHPETWEHMRAFGPARVDVLAGATARHLGAVSSPHADPTHAPTDRRHLVGADPPSLAGGKSLSCGLQGALRRRGVAREGFGGDVRGLLSMTAASGAWRDEFCGGGLGRSGRGRVVP